MNYLTELQNEKLYVLAAAAEIVNTMGMMAPVETRESVATHIMKELGDLLKAADANLAEPESEQPKPKRRTCKTVYEPTETPVAPTPQPEQPEPQDDASPIETTQAIKAVAEDAVAEDAVAEEPTAEEPTAEEPTAEEPTAEEAVAEEPTAEEPTAEEPTAEEPTAEEPTAEEPTAEEPTAELDYELDVKPAVLAAAMVNRGEAVALLASFGAKKATEVAQDQWGALIAGMKAIADAGK